MENINELIETIQINRPDIEVKETHVVKNGVCLQGITLKYPGENIAPNIYLKDLEGSCRTVGEIADAAIKIFDERKIFCFDIQKLLTPEYIINTVLPVLQKKSMDGNPFKKDCIFPGTELYLAISDRADDGSEFSVRITDSIVESANIDIGELWQAAWMNLEKDVTITPFCDLIASIMDKDADLELPNPELYVVTSSRKVKAAAAVLTKKFRDWCRQMNYESVYVLPSSLHEVIVVNKTDDISKAMLDNMVRSVNEEEVDPLDQLGDEAFVYDLHFLPAFLCSEGETP